MPTLQAPTSILLPDGSQLPARLLISGRGAPTYVALCVLIAGEQQILDITDALSSKEWAQRIGGYFDEQE